MTVATWRFYYAYDYMESHKDSPRPSPKDFATAKQGVTRMSSVGLVNAAKAANLRKAEQLPNCAATAAVQPFKNNWVYRVGLAVGQGANVNHETMMLTGVNEILLFEPCFGFYHIDGIAPGGYHGTFEAQIAALYGNTPVSSFEYLAKRKAFSP